MAGVTLPPLGTEMTLQSTPRMWRSLEALRLAVRRHQVVGQPVAAVGVVQVRMDRRAHLSLPAPSFTHPFTLQRCSPRLPCSNMERPVSSIVDSSPPPWLWPCMWAAAMFCFDGDCVVCACCCCCCVGWGSTPIPGRVRAFTGSWHGQCCSGSGYTVAGRSARTCCQHRRRGYWLHARRHRQRFQ